MGTGSGDPMSNLNQLVEWLDPTKVEVVTLEELMVHLRNNFGVPITAGLPGDYNHDGVVDAADYTVWRDTVGSTTDLRANGDDTGASAGIIDQADFVFWKGHFGQSGSGAGAGANAVVPEPETLPILLACTLTMIARRLTLVP
jgi:hypothetical protein